MGRVAPVRPALGGAGAVGDGAPVVRVQSGTALGLNSIPSALGHLSDAGTGLAVRPRCRGGGVSRGVGGGQEL